MVPFLFPATAALPAQVQAVDPPAEPPGSRLSGQFKPFREEPFPPDWVRLESHALVEPDCHHYGYEAYADATHWLVRYVMLPEASEGFREIELVLLLPRQRNAGKPQRLKPADLAVEPDGCRWKGRTFRLVDRRDLVQD